MTSRARLLLSLLLAAATLSSCAPAAVVVVSSAYDPAVTRRVALVSFDDYPGTPGSGEIAAGIFDKYLLLGGYRLMERRQVVQVLREHAFELSGSFDRNQVRALGKLLGVDALAFGSLTDFTDARQQTSLVDMPLENTNPIYGQVVTVQKNRGTRVTTIQNVVTGYSTTRTSAVMPQTMTLPAHVGLSMRLVDARTAEVLWSASASSSGSDLPSAAEEAAASAMRAVAAQLKAALQHH
ncbi:MAG: hypothetical protein KGJ84_12045 [Elusimicrobia bacterium]|nr:hypothetical protein [Elusimicrobiota bacterium]